jgi:Acetyltransferase (GNAT) domain
MITLSFREQMVYKYGASDAVRHSLGSVPLLMWEIIEHAKNHGYRELDLGRSALDHKGLLRFKDHLGAQRTIFDYRRHPADSGLASPKNLGLRMVEPGAGAHARMATGVWRTAVPTRRLVAFAYAGQWDIAQMI